MWNEEVLHGKTIRSARIKDETIWLQTDGGKWITIEVRGDCCSDATIESVVFAGTPTLTGAMITAEFPAEATTQEYDELTSVVFQCHNNGYFRLLHRNSSNGYYSNYLAISETEMPPPDDAIAIDTWRKVAQ